MQGKMKWQHNKGFKWGSILLILLFIASLITACGDNSKQGSTENAVSKEEPTATITETSQAESDKTSTNVEQAQFPLTLTDELNHEVKLEQAPVNVFAPNLEDYLSVLGVKPVAQWANGPVTQSYLQDYLKDVPLSDFSGGAPSPEVVMTYNPDLIILHNAAYEQNGVYESYEKLAPTYMFKQANNDVEATLLKLGELLGKKAEAEQVLTSYKEKVQGAKEKLAPIVDDKKAAIIRFNAKGMFFMGANYFGGYVLHHELGFAVSDLVGTNNSADVSLEALSSLDADYIFLVNDSHLGDQYVKELTESSIWKGLDVVKQGHVYEVSDRHWLSGGILAHEQMIDDVLEIFASE